MTNLLRWGPLWHVLPDVIEKVEIIYRISLPLKIYIKGELLFDESFLYQRKYSIQLTNEKYGYI